jgi:opacity protein-like surface antigen
MRAMNTKLVLASLPLAITASASVAHAGAELGAEAIIVPTGEITVGDDDLDSESAVAYGVGALLDFAISPNISVGFAPRYIFNIKGEGFDEDADGASQLDLMVRVTGRAPLSRGAELFVFGAPGYSMIFLPEDLEDFDDPTGFTVGVGGGARFKLNPSLALVGEVGYSWGFQSTEVLDEDVDVQTDLLHVGIGVQAVL